VVVRRLVEEHEAVIHAARDVVKLAKPAEIWRLSALTEARGDVWVLDTTAPSREAHGGRGTPLSLVTPRF
jgi:hypothetical protein